MPDIDRVREQIADLSRIPADVEGKAAWLTAAERGVAFLREMAMSDATVLYASCDHVFVRGMLANASKLAPPDAADLQGAYVNATSGWAIEHVSGGGQAPQVYLSSPLSGAGRTLSDGEQLVFLRQMEGGGRPAYLELNQRLVQALRVHFIDELSAYCRVNDSGDFEALIWLVDLGLSPGGWGPGRAVVIDSSALGEYMTVTDTALVVRFDFTRFEPNSFGGWGHIDRSVHASPDLGYETGISGGQGSFANGWMVARPALTKADLIRREQARWDRGARDYASFVIHDWRNGRVVECSTRPGASTNYFDRTEGLPFEVSPAFFRPDVLARYKADTDKFKIVHNSIRCRNAWELRSFGVNSKGQVYAYLIDLSHLPYDEQMYWKTFNEEPRAPISKRSVRTDFEGNFDTEYDPLSSIRTRVRELNDSAPPWWTRREDALMDTVHYPLAGNATEWADEVLRLDQAIIEGFRKRGFQDRLRARNKSFDPQWGSLKLIEEDLTSSGWLPEDAKDVVASLRELHELRNVLKAHSSDQGKRKAERDAIKTFGSYRAHYEDLARRCDESVNSIVEFLSAD